MIRTTNFPLILFILLIMSCVDLHAQSVPTPAPPQRHPVLITGATIHFGNGKPAEAGQILFEKGKITAIGNVDKIPSGVDTIDASGKHIYPGLIAVNSQIGLNEIDAVRATADYSEVGNFNPNLRSIIAFNTDSRVTPTVRSNGILMAQLVPKGKAFAGQSSVVQLDAWSWEDAVYAKDNHLHLYWPGRHYKVGQYMPSLEDQKKQSDERVAEIHHLLDQSKAYYTAREKGEKIKTDFRFDAMVPVFKKEKKLFIHADQQEELEEAIAVKVAYDINVVIVGGKESYLVTGLLKEHKIPVILIKTHRLPYREDEDIDIGYKLPSILKKEEIPFCITMQDFGINSWGARNLPFQAGSAVAYGLSKEDALQSITLWPAQVLGVDDRCGSLDIGKDATLLIVEGDLLDIRTSNVEQAFIQGRKIDLGSRQKDLYLKYKKRYKGE